MFNQYWDSWKKGFGAWEKATASYLESVVSNPVMLGGAGSLLSSAMKTKAATDKALATWWGSLGLPTKRDQERGLHKLNTLESRLFDLEEELAELRAEQKKSKKGK
jgi:hypothetical protein